MIYLDNNGTTLLDSRLREDFLCFHSPSLPINASSMHAYGRIGQNMLYQARERIARILQVSPGEVFFSSGATESLNFILRGIAEFIRGREVLTTGLEHPAVLHTLEDLRRKSLVTIRKLPVDRRGYVLPEDIEAAISPQTALLVLMAANNETGVQMDWHSVAALAHRRSLLFVVDGVASFGKEAWRGIPPGVSAFCLSGHKIHGPQGVGLCFVHRSVQLPSLLTGGGQEWGKRAGTENLWAIRALSLAVQYAVEEEERIQRIEKYRDHLEKRLLGEISDLSLNGQGARVCNTCNLYFSGISAEDLLMRLDEQGVLASHGSSCSNGLWELSHVLLEMGYERERVASSVRFSLSKDNTFEEIDRAVDQIKNTVIELRKWKCI